MQALMAPAPENLHPSHLSSIHVVHWSWYHYQLKIYSQCFKHRSCVQTMYVDTCLYVAHYDNKAIHVQLYALHVITSKSHKTNHKLLRNLATASLPIIIYLIKYWTCFFSSFLHGSLGDNHLTELSSSRQSIKCPHLQMAPDIYMYCTCRPTMYAVLQLYKPLVRKHNKEKTLF